MKTIVEFGIRGGRWSKHVCPTIKAGTELANKLAYVFGLGGGLYVKHGCPRMSITSSTHFVSLSLLDGESRGDDVEAWRTEKMI